MARVVIAVGGLKGGVGKSTVAVNLAAALAGKRRVVLFDVDPQATAMQWAEGGRLPMPVESAPLTHPRDVEQWAARVVAVAADVLVLDLPPHGDIATAAALALCAVVLVPITPSGADLHAATATFDLIAEARIGRRGRTPAVLLIPSRVDKRTASGRELAGALRGFDEPIGPQLGDRSAFVDAFSVGESVLQFAPRSLAAEEVAALAAAVVRRHLR